LSNPSANAVRNSNSFASARWLAIPRPRPGARARLILAPHAGGSPAWYAGWGDELPAEVELNVLHMPGRGSRHAETAVADFASLIATLAPMLAPRFGNPYALYGHSLGSLIAFELARELVKQGGRPPARLFVSGCPAPHLVAGLPSISDMPDDAFVNELRRLGGIPDEVLVNNEILLPMLPSLRADMALFESYVHREPGKLDCPILALGGSEDRFAGRRALEGWQEYTSDGSDVRIFRGDHFFIREHRGEIVRLVAYEILQHMTGG
jgi:medium-chain acyl-[acyl-carrier-protein] hydrolase